MYVCIMNQSGTVLVHKNLPAQAEAFLRTIQPLPGRHRRGSGVHIHLVLDCRSVQPGRDPFRARPRAVHESDVRHVVA